MGSIFLKFIAGVLFLSCMLSVPAYAQYGQYDEEELYASPQLSFSYVTSQVFKPRCYRCHSDAGGNKKGVNLETYDNVYALRAKIYEMAIVRKVMPPRRAGGPLNARQMSILSTWLRAGAPYDAATTADELEL